MDLVGELFLTAFLALLFSFIVAKLVSMSMPANCIPVPDLKEIVDEEEMVTEELQYTRKCEPVEIKTHVPGDGCVDQVQRRDPEEYTESEEIQIEGSDFSSKEEESDDPAKGEDDPHQHDRVEDATAAKSGHRTEVAEIESAKEIEIIDDDDWEGIEKSELEKAFTAASKFIEANHDEPTVVSIASDVKMEMYALHKLVTEGPCRDPQPMALMLSSRAKWNAWQKLGNMIPERAMERYVALLSGNVQGWMQDNVSSGASSKLDSSEEGLHVDAAPTFSAAYVEEVPTKRTREVNPETVGDGSIASTNINDSMETI